MPKETGFRQSLEGVLKITAENQGLFFWVEALKTVMPSIQLKSAILLFYEKYNISEEEWPLSTAEQLFFRYSKKEMFNETK
jgi:hypothetical protein